MPSVFTHPAPALALAVGLGPNVIPPRLAAAMVTAAVLPDLDVASFAFEVRYASALGHRGMSHSLLFALVAAAIAAAAAPLLRAGRITAFLAVLFATLSHTALDALTTGGLGVAFFWPFDGTRHFLPWRPIAVSPFSLRAFFTEWGQQVLLSELRWVWRPCCLFALAGIAVRWAVRLSGSNRPREHGNGH